MPGRDVAPLITEGKYVVCKRRLFQTITGGIKWLGYDIPRYVALLQLVLWILPLTAAIPFVLLAEFIDSAKFYFAIGYGVTMGLLVAGFETMPLTCRNQSIVVDFQQTDEEDSIDLSSGCWRKELSNFLFASRKHYMLVLHPLLSAVLCGSVFVQLLPLSLNDVFPVGVVVVLLPLGWLAVLVAHYSIIAQPPSAEPAVYTTTTPTWLMLLARPSHVIITSAVYYILEYWVDVPTVYTQLLYIGFCLLSLGWLLGILSPPEALVSWVMERALVILLGGSPMATDFRTIVMIVLSVLPTVVVAVIGDRTSSVCVAAACGLLLSQDVFSSFDMLMAVMIKENMCLSLFKALKLVGIENTYFSAGVFNKTYSLNSVKSHVLFFILATIRTSIFTVVVLAICITVHNEFNESEDIATILGYALVGLFVLYKVSTHCRQLYILGLIRNPLLRYTLLADDVAKLKQKKSVLITVTSVIYGSFCKGISFVMLAYLSVTLQCVKSPCDDAWLKIVFAVTTIRSLRKIWQLPGDALAGITIAFLLQRISSTWDSDIPVGTQLLVTDFVVEIAVNFWQKMKFSLLLFGTFLVLEKYRKHEFVITSLTIVFLPLVLATIGLAAALSAPLLPLFTLPIFLVSFPRAKRTWPSRFNCSKSCSPNSDSVYYRQAVPALASCLQQAVTSGCITPRAGDQVLFRFQDRIVWTSILEVGSTFFTVTFQGLELQETSCHTVEAAKLDTLFESTSLLNPLPFHTLHHIETSVITTYSDAKNVLTGIIDQPDNLNRLSDRLIKCLIWVILQFFIKGEHKTANINLQREADIESHNSVFPRHQSVKASIGTSKQHSIQTGTTHHILGKGFSRDSLVHPTISGTLTEASSTLQIGSVKDDEPWSTLPGLVAPDKPVDTLSWASSVTGDQLHSDSVTFTTALPFSSTQNNTNTFFPLHKTDQVSSTFISVDSEPFFPNNWASSPLLTSQLNKLLTKFPHEWLHHVRDTLKESCSVTKENLKLVEHSFFCDSFAKLVVTCYSILEGVDACSSPMQVYRSFKGTFQWSKNMEWITGDPVLSTLVQKAYRYAVKLMYDEACLGEADDLNEIVEYLKSYDDKSFIGCEEEESWRQAVLQEIPNLFSLGYNSNDGTFTAHVLTLQEQTVFIGSLNAEAARAFWSALNMELIYLTNDDDERYSIQAHPYLLRNITIQAAQPPLGYPIYCSGLISVSL